MRLSTAVTTPERLTAALLGDNARAVSLLPLGFGTTGTAHRHVIGEMLQHYAPFQDLIKPRG